MKKIKFYIFGFLAFAYIAYLQYANFTYERQIKYSQNLINKLVIKDSIFSSVLNIQDKDSLLSIIRRKDLRTGKILSYEDLDSLCNEYLRRNELLEQIILSAKRHYKFNYSYKIKGDSIIISFWNKY
mgnify:CR=1 FL=1